jgi:hypothetical protein
VFWGIRSVQNVQNDRTNIFGLKIPRNTPYGVTSYLYIMISVRFFVKKCFLKKTQNGKNDLLWDLRPNRQRQNDRTLILLL